MGSAARLNRSGLIQRRILPGTIPFDYFYLWLFYLQWQKYLCKWHVILKQLMFKNLIYFRLAFFPKEEKGEENVLWILNVPFALTSISRAELRKLRFQNGRMFLPSTIQTILSSLLHQSNCCCSKKAYWIYNLILRKVPLRAEQTRNGIQYFCKQICFKVLIHQIIVNKLLWYWFINYHCMNAVIITRNHEWIYIKTSTHQEK